MGRSAVYCQPGFAAGCSILTWKPSGGPSHESQIGFQVELPSTASRSALGASTCLWATYDILLQRDIVKSNCLAIGLELSPIAGPRSTPT
mmetsp:Transcript_25947/g.71536  ORF Transcript_25947/g.71536 Transcript_25947/m.71536 type:complete len:90 (+) Transcript_25947:146-415(+)